MMVENTAYEILFREWCGRLTNAGIDQPAREVRLLVAHGLAQDYQDVLFSPPAHLPFELVNGIHQWILRRCQREPFAKIVGKKEFWGLSFLVTAETLDPRPDSEALIIAIKKFFLRSDSVRVLDLGTGSGCLLLAALSEFPKGTGIGIDRSFKALWVAKKNGIHLQNQIGLPFASRVQWICADWSIPLPWQEEKILGDIVLCNPPYIGIKEKLDCPEIHYDPPSALFSGEDGLEDYRGLAKVFPRILSPKGKVFLEIGQGQATSVVSLIQQEGLALVHIEKDLSGQDRCLVFQQRKENNSPQTSV